MSSADLREESLPLRQLWQELGGLVTERSDEDREGIHLMDTQT
jgi:hypothetical protein